MRFKSRSRALAASALAASLGLAGLGLVAPAAQASEPTASERLEGQFRYETAVDVSQETFAGGSTDVVLATGEDYADALAGNGLAGHLNAPVLLTPTDTLYPATLAEIERLGADNVWIMGGTEAISADVEAALDAAGYNTERRGGINRIETAVDIAEEIGAANIGDTMTDQRTAIVVRGFNFPDAVSASSAAFAETIPVLLTHSDDLSDSTDAALTDLGIERVLILGGTDAVSAAVETEIEGDGITVDRFAGDFRYDTAIDFAQDFLMAELGWAQANGSGYDLATGEKFPDALAAGPHAGTNEYPIILTPSETVYQPVATFLAANCEVFDIQVVIGGTAAVAQDVADAHAAAARCDTNQSFAVTPDTVSTNPESTSTTTNEGRIQYSVSGLDDTLTYDIFVLPAENVTDTNGVISFRDVDGTANEADFTATSATIETINNTAFVDAPTNGTALDVSPVNGTILFTVDSLSPDEVIPVIFLDADNGSTETTPDLDLDDNDQPIAAEFFGIGGQKNFVAPEAASSGDAADGRVEGLDKEANSIGVDTDETATVGDYAAADVDVRYLYDSNDTFAIGGVPATLAEFEAALSRGDGLVVGAYSQDETLVSSFNIVDGPLAPTTVAAEKGAAGAENDITVVVDFDQPTLQSMYHAVVIQRAPVTGGTDEAADGTVGTYATVATVDISADLDASTATFTYLDEDVATGVYRYRAAGVIDGDTGAFTADTTNESSTTPTADTTAPTSTYAALVDDTGFAAEADAGDDIRIIFSEAVVVEAGDAIRLLEGTDATQGAGEEEFQLTCGANVTCTTNDSAVVIGGDTYAAGRVLTVTFSSAPAPLAAVTGGDSRLDFPAFITNQAGIVDAANNAWNVTGSSDRTVEVDASAPVIASAAGTAATQTITLTYDRQVDCADLADVRNQFSFTDATDTGVSPTAITCNGTTTVVLTFAALTLDAADDTGDLTYAENVLNPNVRMRGLNSIEAVSPETEANVAIA